MNKHTAFALWFKEISKNDIPIAGGKGANLRIILLKDSIVNWADQYSLSIPLTSNETELVLSINDFKSKTISGKKVSFILDTGFTKNILKLAKDSNVLISSKVNSDWGTEKYLQYNSFSFSNGIAKSFIALSATLIAGSWFLSIKNFFSFI